MNSTLSLEQYCDAAQQHRKKHNISYKHESENPFSFTKSLSSLNVQQEKLQYIIQHDSIVQYVDATSADYIERFNLLQQNTLINYEPQVENIINYIRTLIPFALKKKIFLEGQIETYITNIEKQYKEAENEHLETLVLKFEIEDQEEMTAEKRTRITADAVRFYLLKKTQALLKLTYTLSDAVYTYNRLHSISLPSSHVHHQD